MSLTENIFQKAKDLGADLVGSLRIEQLEKNPRAIEEINKIDSGARSILVFAVRMVSSSIACAQKNIRIPQFSTSLLYNELGRINFALMKELDERGFSACPVPTYLPVPMDAHTQGLIAELSLRELGYLAGLGVIGKNRLLITKEFGPRVRLGAILTSAELDPGEPLNQDLCGDCELCIKSCPSGALRKKGEEASKLCARQNLKYGLPGLIRFAIKLIKAPSEDEKINLILSPEFWEYWQNLNMGIFYYCFNCLNSCPIGK